MLAAGATAVAAVVDKGGIGVLARVGVAGRVAGAAAFPGSWLVVAVGRTQADTNPSNITSRSGSFPRFRHMARNCNLNGR